MRGGRRGRLGRWKSFGGGFWWLRGGFGRVFE